MEAGTEEIIPSDHIPTLDSPTKKRTNKNGPERITTTDARFLGLLQQITKCGNDWQPYLSQLKTTPSLESQSKCIEVFGMVQALALGYMSEAEKLLVSDSELLRYWGDVLTHIEVQWQIISSEVNALSTSGQTDDGSKARRWISIIDASGFAAAEVTVTVRINDILKSVAVGESIKFDDVMQDDIPDAAYRKKFLVEVDNELLSVDGYVDVTNGTITRISVSNSRPWLQLFGAIVLMAACEGALYGFLRWSGAPGLQPVGLRPSAAILLSNIGFIWLGMFAHVAIAWYKGFRQAGAHVPRSAKRILYLIGAKGLAIWMAIIVGALLGYAFILTGHVSQAGAALAIGYSADSLVDTLVPRFNKSLVQIAKALPIP